MTVFSALIITNLCYLLIYLMPCNSSSSSGGGDSSSSSSSSGDSSSSADSISSSSSSRGTSPVVFCMELLSVLLPLQL